jgi:hypothetical protein
LYGIQVKKEGEKVVAPDLNDTFFKGLKDFLLLYSLEGNALEKKQLDLQVTESLSHSHSRPLFLTLESISLALALPRSLAVFRSI